MDNGDLFVEEDSPKPIDGAGHRRQIAVADDEEWEVVDLEKLEILNDFGIFKNFLIIISFQNLFRRV